MGIAREVAFLIRHLGSASILHGKTNGWFRKPDIHFHSAVAFPGRGVVDDQRNPSSRGVDPRADVLQTLRKQRLRLALRLTVIHQGVIGGPTGGGAS